LGDKAARPELRLVSRRGDSSEHGSAVVLGAVAIAILMAVFIGALNFVLDEYAKGAVRTAVDEAAQAGASAGGSLTACEAEVARVRASLLPGIFGSDVTINCSQVGDEVVVTAAGDLPSLLPPVPRVSVSLVGVSLITEVPAQ
jgi:hypothetical protein